MLDLFSLALSLLKKLIFPFLLLSLIISNGLTLFNANIYDALYSTLARFTPMHWRKNSPANRLAARTQKIKHLKQSSKKITRRVTKRTIRNISANLAAIPAESIPAVGIGVIIAITAMDLHDACADLKDMNELNSLMDIKTEQSDTQKICGMSLPKN